MFVDTAVLLVNVGDDGVDEFSEILSYRQID
jgi:hypothetical protein